MPVVLVASRPWRAARLLLDVGPWRRSATRRSSCEPRPTVDVALHRARPLAGLAVLSGTRIDGAAWRAGLARVRGVPVLVSHGTRDAVLPFAVARSLRDELAAAGAVVEWVEFAGGHTIPAATVDQLARLITRVTSTP